jgi:PilZ domain
MSPDVPESRGVIASHVNGRCFAPGARLALERLGYRVVWASALGSLERSGESRWRPSLRIADERLVARLPLPADDPDTPVVLLTGPRPVECHDRRVVGRVPKPADLRHLYPILQRALEPHPRRAARAPTLLSARLGRDDRRWSGSVLTLSEEGCLFEGGAPLPTGAPLNLEVALSGTETVSVRARGLYHLGSRQRAALCFEQPAPDARSRIASYVATRLATL